MKRFFKFLVVFPAVILIGTVIFCLIKNYSPQTTFLNPTSFRPPAVKFPKFAVMADIHSDVKNLKQALEMAKNDQVEFVVIAGDLTTLGKKSELLAIRKTLRESGLKYYIIPGNHDLWSGRRIKENIFGEIFSPDFQSFKTDNKIKFIFLNNADDYLGISDEQNRRLMTEIQECPKIYCLVFIHEPLNHPYSSHIMGENDLEVASQAALLRQNFVNYKIKEVFAGHLHFSSSYEIDGLKTTVVGSLSRERNSQEPRFWEIWGEKEEERKEVVLPY